MLALARANQSKWAEAGQAVRGAVQAATRSSRPTTPTTPPAAGCGAATRRARSNGRRGWPRGACPRPRRSWCASMRCARSARWSDALAAWRATCSGSRTARAAPRRCSRRPRRWRRRPAAGGERRAARPTPDVTAIYRRVWAEAPLEALGRPRRRAAGADCRRAARRRGGGRARAHRGRAGVARDGAVRPQPQPGIGGRRSRRRWPRPGWTPTSSAGRASTARSRSGSSASARGRRRCSTRPTAACARAGNRDLHAKALYQGARCYASMGERDAAVARYARVEAEHADHSYADDARLRARRSWRPTPATRRRPPRCSPRFRPATRRATCSTRRCGGWRSPPGARAATTRRCAGWTRTCASSRTRRSGTRRGARCTGRGACSRSRGKPDEARAWYERAVREYPLSVYALLSLTRLKRCRSRRAEGAGRRRCARGCTTCPPGRSRRARCTATPGFLRAVELARMGQGGDARRELARSGWRPSAEKHAPRGAARGRGRGPGLDHRDPARSRRRLERVALAPPLRR